VPSCAPHLSQDGYAAHVNDSSTDILYAPDPAHTAYWDVLHAVLDFNHDDYYRAHIPGCPDLSDNPYLTPMVSVEVTTIGSGTVTSDPAGISCPPTCSAFLVPPVTLTATPRMGQKLTGWSDACTGTGACTLNTTGSVSADFAQATHGRSLSLRLHGHRATGRLRVKDGYTACRSVATVIVQGRRGRGPWSTFRRTHTASAGNFAVPIPKRPESYRALAPEATVHSQRCDRAISPTVTAK
jgi:hypothetical protein